MRLTIFIALLFTAALPCCAQQQVSVVQLERILADNHDSPDAELASKLSDLTLTQRYSTARLEHWRTLLPGPRSQRALLGVADRSVFLDPPNLPSIPAPDLNQQRRIMGLAADYVARSIPQLPNFYATRTLTHFEEAPGYSSDAVPGTGPLRATRITRATVRYQGGEETVDPGPVKIQSEQHADQGLTSWGAFGPLLSLVLLDAARSTLAWDHWEQQGAAPVAVFRYVVPAAQSHYQVRYCCIVHQFGLESTYFEQMSGYRGQITVDPATGVILRITLEADLKPTDSITHAALAVEYAPIEMGGTTLICPVRSVSISLAKTVRQVQTDDGHMWNTMGPLRLLLNHADFDQYHLFRAQSRILSAGEERAAGQAPDATLPATPPADTRPAEQELADASDLEAPSGPVLNPTAPSGETPEITTSASIGLPDEPFKHISTPQEGDSTGFRLRINARLVDVNVVALDNKGRPIPNLKPEDFEIYDNGVKQDLRSFSPAVESSSEGSVVATLPGPSQLTPVFSNSPADRPKAGPIETSTLVFLIDPGNLVFNDFADARQQILRFLKQIPADERVALYAMRYHGFQILQEATSDHDLIASRLAKWMQSAQDLLNARDEEDRNRQTFETVHSPEDLLSANGGVILDSESEQEAMDPKMRELGSAPGPNSLALLAEVARHLAPMPGQKSLVWITSDNVLADWNNGSVTIEKTSKVIEPAALRAQEAMNNAQVSVYPLDASRLEANVIGADIGHLNVELTPTYQRPAQYEALQEGPEMTSGLDANVAGQNRDLRSGRMNAQMHQDLKPIQGVFREVAEATGGRAFARSNNIQGELKGIVTESRATYLIGFSPNQPADGKYHLLTVKLAGRRDATLRYRTGYQYDKEPATLKQRFAQAIWNSTDSSEIALSARPIADAEGKALRVTVAGSDLELARKDALWTGKLDIFLARRDEVGQHARVTGQTIGLHLKPPTYEHAMKDGLTFDERLDAIPGKGSLRIVVVDSASGRMGSITVPSAALAAQP